MLKIVINGGIWGLLAQTSYPVCTVQGARDLWRKHEDVLGNMTDGGEEEE